MSEKTVRSFSSLSLKGKVPQALSANETDQEVLHTKTVVLPLNSTAKMVDLSLLLKRKKWSRSSVYKRKLLSSDWFAFRKNMRKSRKCKKKKKMTESSK